MKILTGIRFGRLVVVGSPIREGERTFYMCRCDCGVLSKKAAAHLSRGSCNSCGCLRDELNKTRPVIHGRTKTREYFSWKSMIARCKNEKDPCFKYYGGRGIKVCDRWKKFICFFEDMGFRPAGKTLDRKNNSLGYFKENCRWASAFEQTHNRRKYNE